MVIVEVWSKLPRRSRRLWQNSLSLWLVRNIKTDSRDHGPTISSRWLVVLTWLPELSLSVPPTTHLARRLGRGTVPNQRSSWRHITSVDLSDRRDIACLPTHAVPEIYNLQLMPCSTHTRFYRLGSFLGVCAMIHHGTTSPRACRGLAFIDTYHWS